METKKQKQVKKVKRGGVSSGILIAGCALVAGIFFFGYCGHEMHFDAKGHPLNGNIFGTLYMGGFVIPVVMTLLLSVLALSVERAFALNRAKGKANLLKFVDGVKVKIEAEDLEGARKMCDAQKGSVANILLSAMLRYEDIEKSEDLSNDEKAGLVQKEIEEATTLELPVMEQNMPIIAAISTLGTLMGLFGTVLGMIKSFGAMGQEGAPDSTKLAVGISEALLNTALGIGTGALAIIAYTYFSGKIQNITNAVDEIGFAIGQTFTKKALKK